MVLQKTWFFGWVLLFIPLAGSGQADILKDWPSQSIGESFTLYTHQSDTFFGVPQMINVLSLGTESIQRYRFDMAYSDSILIPTSVFAKTYDAIAGINGSYFDIRNGGSVTYLEIDGQKIDITRPSTNKHINGAVVIRNDGSLVIEPFRPDQAYARSSDEEDVLVSGPLLISKGIPENLPETAFVTTRHPRTCLCITPEVVLLITIDGRRETAYGMDLHELQAFLESLDCRDALNLDGGGSTTLWVRDAGSGRVVNQPSDLTGERPVANALLIRERTIQDQK